MKVKYLTLEEFRSLISGAGICGDELTDREINICFNLSMMTAVDEITKSRHMQMSVIELYEALARIAEIYSPFPVDSLPDGEVVWTPDKR